MKAKLITLAAMALFSLSGCFDDDDDKVVLKPTPVDDPNAPTNSQNKDDKNKQDDTKKEEPFDAVPEELKPVVSESLTYKPKGKGKVSIDGKELKPGESYPLDTLSQETLHALVRDGQESSIKVGNFYATTMNQDETGASVTGSLGYQTRKAEYQNLADKGVSAEYKGSAYTVNESGELAKGDLTYNVDFKKGEHGGKITGIGYLPKDKTNPDGVKGIDEIELVGTKKIVPDVKTKGSDTTWVGGSGAAVVKFKDEAKNTDLGGKYEIDNKRTFEYDLKFFGNRANEFVGSIYQELAHEVPIVDPEPGKDDGKDDKASGGKRSGATAEEGGAGGKAPEPGKGDGKDDLKKDDKPKTKVEYKHGGSVVLFGERTK